MALSRMESAREASLRAAVRILMREPERCLCSVCEEAKAVILRHQIGGVNA